MGLRYRIPFKDYKDNSYVVEIHREDYTGEVTELTGATSCFVVSGTDDDFMYTPVRTSSATINVLDSDLLLDLYSINNQFAPVKLMKNGVLEWTGYIKPEQFTQPYVNMPTNIGVECVSALTTLENVEYKEFSGVGKVTMWRLLDYMISNAKGGYRGVYIPHMYGSSSSMSTNVLEEISLIENNFLNEEMNCLEVLEAVCKFLNWTVYDIGGYIYFVDADWKGEYRLYDEALNSYTSVSGNEVMVQDIGFNGSDGNTLDVVPGYNKASVKSLNHVFDDVVKDEEYDILDQYYGGYLIGYYNNNGLPYACRKKFLKPMLWKVFSYSSDGKLLSQDELENLGAPSGLENYWMNLNVYGALLMSEANYELANWNEPTPAEGVTDYDYKDSIQIRVGSTLTSNAPVIGGDTPVVEMRGEYAVYADCAISIDCQIEGYYDDDLFEPSMVTSVDSQKIQVSINCDGKWYDGTEWVSSYSTVWIETDENGQIKTNRTPDTPYKDISGYVIPMDFFVGAPVITIMAPLWMEDGDVRYLPGVKIRNLKFGYAKKEGIVDEGENGDRVYENVVNESYMSDAEEIEFEISSYNADGASYSKAMIDGGWLTDNLYCAIVGKNIRPEELMIRRIVNRYGVTKIKLTEALQMTDSITPLTILTERTQKGKTFRMTSGEWDYEQNRFIIQMQEDTQ